MSRATIKTIAAEAGVSIATVSKALNDMPDISDEVKARIREIARRQGYVTNTAARELASGNSYFVGIILPDILDPVAAQVYKALSQRLERAGYSVFLNDSGADAQREALLIDEMFKKRVAVLIVMPSTTDMRHIENAVQSRIPVIYIGGAVNPAAQNSISCDDYKGGMTAAGILFQNGCRSAAVLTWGGGATAQHERARGFMAFMQEKGVFVKVYQAQGDPSEESGRLLAEQLLGDTPMVQGIFSTDDLIAIGAMDCLKKRGLRVPKDIELIGYGDSRCAALGMVGLSSIAIPGTEMGICASEVTLSILRNDMDAPRRLTLVPRFVPRASTKPLGAAN